MRMQNHWWLGVLGLVGFYKLPLIVAAFAGAGSWFDYLNLLWFLWFLYLIPEEDRKEGETR